MWLCLRVTSNVFRLKRRSTFLIIGLVHSAFVECRPDDQKRYNFIMDSSGVAVAVPEVADALAAQRAYHEVPDLTARSAGSIGGLREAFVRRNISNSGLLISAKNGTTNNRHVQLIGSLFY